MACNLSDSQIRVAQIDGRRWWLVVKIRERWWIHAAVEWAGINGGLRWLHGSPVTCGSWRWLVVVMCHMWWCNRDWTSRWLGAGWLNELDELSDTNLEQNELSYIEVVMDRARKEESRPKPDDRSEFSFSVKKETKIHSPCLEVKSQDHKPRGWRKLFSVCLPWTRIKTIQNSSQSASQFIQLLSLQDHPGFISFVFVFYKSLGKLCSFLLHKLMYCFWIIHSLLSNKSLLSL